jgi:hypothetical protein
LYIIKVSVFYEYNKCPNNNKNFSLYDLEVYMDNFELKELKLLYGHQSSIKAFEIYHNQNIISNYQFYLFFWESNYFLSN